MEQSADLIKEMFAPGPRPLLAIDGEILFAGGHALYHYTGSDGSEIMKYISAETLRMAFSNTAVDSGWLALGIIRCGINLQGPWYIKLISPQVHTVLLQNTRRYSKEIKPFKVPLPGMVFMAHSSHYFVFAFKGAVCDPKALLFKAPLSNLYENGRVCWGSNQMPVIDHASSEQAWQLFISSPFNCDLANSKSQRFSLNVLDQLEELAGCETYPEDDLEKAVVGYGNLSLEGYVRQFILKGEAND